VVDITLYDLETGREIPMTGVYDEMSDRLVSHLSRRHIAPAVSFRRICFSLSPVYLLVKLAITFP